MTDHHFHFLVNARAGKLSNATKQQKLHQAITGVFNDAAVAPFSDAHTFSASLSSAFENGSIPIIVGGDGSISRLCSALISKQQAQTPKFGVLPLGTGNDAARCLGLSSNLVENLERLKSGQNCRDIDLLEVKVDGQVIGHGLTLCAMGLPATVIGNTDGLAWLGALKYSVGTLRSLFSAQPALPTVSYSPTAVSPKAEHPWLVGIANGQFTGGGMKMVPSASMSDGLADAVILDGTSPFGLLSLLLKVFSGKHVTDPKVTITPSVSMTAQVDRVTELILDGEVFNIQGHLEINVLPRAVHLIA